MKIFWNPKPQYKALLTLTFTLLTSYAPVIAAEKPHAFQQVLQQDQKVISAKKVGTTVIEVLLSNNQHLTFDFYSDQIFRLFQDNSGAPMRDPEAKPEAKILIENPRRPVTKLNLTDENNLITISTSKISVQINKNTSLLKIINLTTNAVVVEETAAIRFEKGEVGLTLKENPQEYFYGGGVQNGRFSHKGKAIAIENQNSWTDGGVASPSPFFWSSKGYGVLWHTFKKGRYDLAPKKKVW